MKKLDLNSFALSISVGLLLGGASGFGLSWHENLQPHFYDPISDMDWNVLTAIFFGIVGGIIGFGLAFLVRGISRINN